MGTSQTSRSSHLTQDRLYPNRQFFNILWYVTGTGSTEKHCYQQCRAIEDFQGRGCSNPSLSVSLPSFICSCPPKKNVVWKVGVEIFRYKQCLSFKLCGILNTMMISLDILYPAWDRNHFDPDYSHCINYWSVNSYLTSVTKVIPQYQGPNVHLVFTNP